MITTDYIVGLVDGEGSFTVYIMNLNNKSFRKRRVRAEPNKNHRHCYRYEIANREHLNKIIIPFFKKHTLQFPSKRKDFKIFCKLMKMIKKRMHLNNIGLRKMYYLKQKMH